MAANLGKNAAIVGVTVAIADSNLCNYANDGTSTQLGPFRRWLPALNDAQRAVRQSLNYPRERIGHDLDSMGLFQQRPE